MKSAATPLNHLKSSATTVQISAFPSSAVSNSSTCAKKPIPITCASTTTTTLQTTPAVLLKAQSELYNWRGSGMSVMEMSHGGKEFMSIIEKAESDLRSLLNTPPVYTILFLQGGATTKCI